MNMTATAPIASSVQPLPIPAISPLASRAMLISISISVWEGRKTDKTASAKVTRDANAKTGRAKVIKNLLDETALAKIISIRQKIYAWHRSLTSPWNRGQDIISSLMYEKYIREFRELQDEFETERESVLAQYAGYRAAAETDMGDLFNPADYPSVQNMRHKFRCSEPDISPLPQAADFRCDIPAAEFAATQAAIAAATENRIREAMRNVCERIATVVGHMAEKLKNYSAGDDETRATPMRESMLTNIADLIDLLPGLNLTNDARISAICERMKELTDTETDELKANAALRKELGAKAAKIAADVADFF